MSQQIILTSQGLEKLKKELEYLKREKRAEVSERIRTAKEYGDLSENAEYHEAKEEQAFVEGRILELEHIIKIAHVADKQESASVGVGNVVKLDRNGSEVIFEIVGATEADPSAGKISLDSPLGQALLGKQLDEAVSITTPSGVITYVIKGIQ